MEMDESTNYFKFSPAGTLSLASVQVTRRALVHRAEVP